MPAPAAVASVVVALALRRVHLAPAPVLLDARLVLHEVQVHARSAAAAVAAPVAFAALVLRVSFALDHAYPLVACALRVAAAELAQEQEPESFAAAVAVPRPCPAVHLSP